MQYTDIFGLLFVPFGLISLFKPFLLICLFATIPILSIASSISEYDSPIKIVQIGTINVYAIDWLILICAAVMWLILLKELMFKRLFKSWLFIGPINKIIYALFAWEIIIGILSFHKGFYIQNILRYLSYESIMFLTVLIPQIQGLDLKRHVFFNYLKLLCMILVFVAVWRYGISHDVDFTSSGTLRALSGNSVIIFTVPICSILFFRLNHSSHRRTLYTITIILSIGILFTGHRSGFIVLLFIFLMRSLLDTRTRILFLIIAPLAAVILWMTIMFILPQLHLKAQKSFVVDLILRFNDTFDFKNKTTKDRLDAWSYSVEIFKNDPALGLGTYPAYKNPDDKGIDIESRPIEELKIPPHNMFIDKLLHEGLLGLCMILILFGIIFTQLKRISILDKKYATFLMVYILSFVIFSMFNTTFSNDTGRIYFFIMLGFLNAESIKSYDPDQARASFSLNKIIRKTRQVSLPV